MFKIVDVMAATVAIAATVNKQTDTTMKNAFDKALMETCGGDKRFQWSGNLSNGGVLSEETKKRIKPVPFNGRRLVIEPTPIVNGRYGNSGVTNQIADYDGDQLDIMPTHPHTNEKAEIVLSLRQIGRLLGVDFTDTDPV